MSIRKVNIHCKKSKKRFQHFILQIAKDNSDNCWALSTTYLHKSTQSLCKINQYDFFHECGGNFIIANLQIIEQFSVETDLQTDLYQHIDQVKLRQLVKIKTKEGNLSRGQVQVSTTANLQVLESMSSKGWAKSSQHSGI